MDATPAAVRQKHSLCLFPTPYAAFLKAVCLFSREGTLILVLDGYEHAKRSGRDCEARLRSVGSCHKELNNISGAPEARTFGLHGEKTLEIGGSDSCLGLFLNRL